MFIFLLDMDKVNIYVVPMASHMFLILIMLLDIEIPFKSWIGTSHNVELSMATFSSIELGEVKSN